MNLVEKYKHKIIMKPQLLVAVSIFHLLQHKISCKLVCDYFAVNPRSVKKIMKKLFDDDKK